MQCVLLIRQKNFLLQRPWHKDVPPDPRPAEPRDGSRRVQGPRVHHHDPRVHPRRPLLLWWQERDGASGPELVQSSKGKTKGKSWLKEIVSAIDQSLIIDVCVQRLPWHPGQAFCARRSILQPWRLLHPVLLRGHIQIVQAQVWGQHIHQEVLRGRLCNYRNWSEYSKVLS